MPFNGSGTYSAPASSWNPAVDGVVINSTDWVALLADITTALSTAVLKDGQQAATAVIPFAFGLKSASTIGVGNTAPAASGAGISFPASRSASTDANTLDDYQEGSFTGTLTGVTAGVTATIKYTIVGNVLTVDVPTGFTGTSNATSKTITGAPAEIFPAANKTFLCISTDNGGTATIAQGVFGTDGVLTISPNIAGSNWTSSGTATINRFCFTCLLS